MAQEIWLVEDDPVTMLKMNRGFSKLGYTVTDFVCAEDCLAEFNAGNRPDLIFLDSILPEMSGPELLKILRKTSDAMELPVILATSNDEPQAIVNAFSYGASDYIVKPVHLSIANSRINTQLNLRNYYFESLKKKSLETVNTMIVTYHHEISSPLTSGIQNIEILAEKLQALNLKETEKYTTRAIKSLLKIVTILEKISSVASHDIETNSYEKTRKRLKLDSSS